MLKINGETVCDFGDGGTTITTVMLEKGLVDIESIGFVDGRGGSQGIDVQWKPPGQREFSDIPEGLVFHQSRKGLTTRNPPPTVPGQQSVLKTGPHQDLRARWMTVVAKDFVIEIYKNGKRIPDAKRKLLLDRFGASVEQVEEEVKAGDWIVFHVAHNRLRHRGSKYFAVTGMLDEKQIGYVSSHTEDWSVCDAPSLATEFIRNRDQGTESRAVPIARPWEEGEKFMEKYTGSNYFPGAALWGTAPSTWIKYIVPAEQKTILFRLERDSALESDTKEKPKEVKEIEPKKPGLAILHPNRPPVQHILPESFYGPHDAAELTKWIEGTRWMRPRGEIQFHPQGLLTGPGLPPRMDWKSVDKNWLELSWSENESIRYRFDYVWSSFSALHDGKDRYRIKRK